MTSAHPDMNAHTLTVEFDDESISIDAIVEALGISGYTVPSRRQITD